MHIPTAIQNRRGRLAAIVAVGASLALPLSAQAATHSAYLTVPDFGAKAKTPIAGAIPITDWSWGLEASTNPGTATTGAGAGKVSFNTFKFTKPIDATSPQFMGALTRGQRLDNVRVYVPLNGARKGGAALQLNLSSVFVKNDTLAGTDGQEPTEEIELAVGAVNETYQPDDITGDPLAKVTDGWNRVTNQPQPLDVDGS
ncbi:MAG TPA: type VI secretion system tube protein Hcp [Solirubrobacteraceae bacterium]|jgi:type VI protein secretion system component Hcp